MSKIGKSPIHIPEGVTVRVADQTLRITGKGGELSVPLLQGVTAIQEEEVLRFTAEKGMQSRSNWGTVRSLVANAIEGVQREFKKTLILEGIGYRITKEGDTLILALGFSHPVWYALPPGITGIVEKNTILTLRGIDKQLVGHVAAQIRSLKKPEPYKGKGFRYADEIITRKAGKKAVSAAK